MGPARPDAPLSLSLSLSFHLTNAGLHCDSSHPCLSNLSPSLNKVGGPSWDALLEMGCIAIPNYGMHGNHKYILYAMLQPIHDS